MDDDLRFYDEYANKGFKFMIEGTPLSREPIAKQNRYMKSLLRSQCNSEYKWLCFERYFINQLQKSIAPFELKKLTDRENFNLNNHASNFILDLGLHHYTVYITITHLEIILSRAYHSESTRYLRTMPITIKHGTCSLRNFTEFLTYVKEFLNHNISFYRQDLNELKAIADKKFE